MNTTVFITFWLIVLARIVDVTLDTIRTVAIVQGRRMFSASLGFFQAVVYISAIAKVLLNIDHPIYVLAYGLGFASGTFLGITIETRLAFGHQLVGQADEDAGRAVGAARQQQLLHQAQQVLARADRTEARKPSRPGRSSGHRAAGAPDRRLTGPIRSEMRGSDHHLKVKMGAVDRRGSGKSGFTSL